MAYSQFTLKSVKKTFGLVEDAQPFTQNAQPIPPSDWLNKTIKMGYECGLFSEKARSETLVMPILLELRENNPNRVGVYSGATLETDKAIGLNGECDFILTASKQLMDLECPIFCMIEAKDNDLDLGVGQCVAQMLSARLFNESEGKTLPILYGCSTTGLEWRFLKLEGNTVIIDQKIYSLERLENILGVLQWCVDEAYLSLN